MTFPHLQYKEFSAADFGSWQGWVDAVNKAKEYCKSCVFDEWKGLCAEGDLPSFHPWWKEAIKAADKVSYERTRVTAIHCVKHPDGMKAAFGKFMTTEGLIKAYSITEADLK